MLVMSHNVSYVNYFIKDSIYENHPLMKFELKNGKSAVMMPDCGAVYTLINKQECKRLKLTITYEETPVMKGASGKKLDTIGTTIIPIKLDGGIHEVDAIVLKEELGITLLGRNFFESYECFIGYSQGEWILLNALGKNLVLNEDRNQGLKEFALAVNTIQEVDDENEYLCTQQQTEVAQQEMVPSIQVEKIDE